MAKLGSTIARGMIPFFTFSGVSSLTGRPVTVILFSSLMAIYLDVANPYDSNQQNYRQDIFLSFCPCLALIKLTL